VVIVWEQMDQYNCGKYGCDEDSLRVFAVMRPPGGTFGAPVRLAWPQPSLKASPRGSRARRGERPAGGR
jgi:hypothetical protein